MWLAYAGVQVATSSSLPVEVVFQSDASSAIGSQFCYTSTGLKYSPSGSSAFVQQQVLSQNWKPLCLSWLPYFTSMSIQSLSNSSQVSFCIDEVQLLPSTMTGRF